MRPSDYNRNDAKNTTTNPKSTPIFSLPLPKTIMDGPSTVHKADLFFSAPPPPPVPKNRPPNRHSYSPAKPRTISKPLRSGTAPSSFRPSTLPPPPPLPPKISQSKSDSSWIHAEAGPSGSESHRRTVFLEKLDSQEEDELAKALAQSMREPNLLSSTAGAGPSPPVPTHSRPDSISTSSSSDHHAESWYSFPQSSTSILDDEALARQLAAEEEQEEARRRETGGNEQPSIEADEAFARRLALEEEAGDDEDKQESITPSLAENSLPPPAYANNASSPPNHSSILRNNSSASSQSHSSDPNRSTPSLRAHSDDASSSDKLNQSGYLPLPDRLKDHPEVEGAINFSRFMDQDLLGGVSIGFIEPVILNEPEPMTDVMPNVINLPYGKSPPLHLQAPSWRHLLILMARLSGTHMQPTLEAMQRNEDLYLRTVIQFIKPHWNTPTWKTIVWFTIDQDKDQPGKRANSHIDVDSLPYSYTLMKVPYHLREGCNGPLSRTYTVPSTPSVPYPALPITFPNLALYLQAVLEDSRKYINDSSSGRRNLAKMVQTCYPDEIDSGAGAVERGVGRLFKKVIGRGGGKRGRGGNEETYDLVTPFVPAEWS